MNDATDDRQVEAARYHSSALQVLSSDHIEPDGCAAERETLRQPYIQYHAACRAAAVPGCRILEIGAGTGRHSLAVCGEGLRTTCTDIAPAALQVLERRLRRAGKSAKTVVTPMEETPFPDSSFDLIVSAGSLSYADPDRLDAEIVRVLRPGGSFVCVDSLNHNPIYRVNRWVHWRMKGDRTRSTLVRMPTVQRMQRLGRRFERWDLRGFGAWSWLWSPLSLMIGAPNAARCNDACDSIPCSRRLAFKFVFEAHGLRKDAVATTSPRPD